MKLEISNPIQMIIGVIRCIEYEDYLKNLKGNAWLG